MSETNVLTQPRYRKRFHCIAICLILYIVIDQFFVGKKLGAFTIHLTVTQDSEIILDISESPRVDGGGGDNETVNVTKDDGVYNASESNRNDFFTIHEGVAFVTKTLWAKDTFKIQGMICLINASYNRKVNYKYDFVIFTTIPFSEEEVQTLQGTAAPAKLTVVTEGPSLEERMAALSPEAREFLYERCGVGNGTAITWFHHCKELDKVNGNLGYSWQAEFRAYHIWTHLGLKDYKYMMWFDIDAQVSREWDKDPVDAMVQKNLTLMYTAFPYGVTWPTNPVNKEIADNMKKVYGKPICGTDEVNGTLKADYCNEGEAKPIKQVAGYWHLTNLDVYRKEIHQKYLKLHIGEYPFSRERDDQLAVTIPAAYESSQNTAAALDARQNGFNLMIRHHRKYDNMWPTKMSAGKHRKDVEEHWPDGYKLCGKYL